MKVAEVGTVVRAYRKASGLSQKDLAHMVGISRATLNYLESGRDLEIGAAKLLALLSVLGVPFALPSAVDRTADEALLDALLKSTAGKASGGKSGKRLPRPLLLEALASGRAPFGYQGQAAAFLEAADEPTALAAVRAAASAQGAAPSAVWKGARGLAKALDCSRKVWLREG